VQSEKIGRGGIAIGEQKGSTVSIGGKKGNQTWWEGGQLLIQRKKREKGSTLQLDQLPVSKEEPTTKFEKKKRGGLHAGFPAVGGGLRTAKKRDQNRHPR